MHPRRRFSLLKSYILLPDIATSQVFYSLIFEIMTVIVCHACRCLAEEPERAGEDEKVPAAGGAGVPHGPDGHSGAAGGAGKELPDHFGRLQEDHREARVAGLTGLAETLQMTCPVHADSPTLAQT